MGLSNGRRLKDVVLRYLTRSKLEEVIKEGANMSYSYRKELKTNRYFVFEELYVILNGLQSKSV